MAWRANHDHKTVSYEQRRDGRRDFDRRGEYGYDRDRYREDRDYRYGFDCAKQEQEEEQRREEERREAHQRDLAMQAEQERVDCERHEQEQ